MLRQYNDARDTLQVLLRTVPGCTAGVRLMERMTELELQYPPPTSTGTRAFSAVERPATEQDRWSRQDDILPAFVVPTRPAVPKAEAPSSSIGSTPGLDLSQLAAKLEGARIPALSEEYADDEDGEEYDVEMVNLSLRPQTETLAQIYASQGRYREAVDAFRFLSASRPERAEEYARIIADLERRMAAE